jgi:hypothetical protein
MRGRHFVFMAWVLGGSTLCECNSSNNNCDAGNCADGSTVPPVSGGGCDSSKSPAEGGCAVDDTDGFFVSVAGDDTAAGTKVAPFKTIQKGINAAAAAPSKPNVYVCAGTYAENLVVQNAPAGVAIHGGFDCATFVQISGPTIVAPAWVPNATTPEYVLHVLGAASLIEGMTLTAPDATDPGASSMAALIDGSPGMTFRRATVTAGKASDGVTSTPPATVGPAADGNPGGFESPGAQKICNCTSDVSVGGQGAGTDGGPIQDAGSGAPIVNGNTTAGQPTPCNGGDGAFGLVGKSGASTGTLGEITANGWTSSGGATGGPGGTAQGGAGAWWGPGGATNAGGSGGCGGCGGVGGVGGTGGGGSIGVGAINSTLRVRASTIRAGKAGNGGVGSAGQGGQPGGQGGVSACIGGLGGSGGNGGPGGGGAGGVSIAIAVANTTPDVDGQSAVLAGTAGIGGNDGATPPAKAIDGVADAVHTF